MTLSCLACVIQPSVASGRRALVRVMGAMRARPDFHLVESGSAWLAVGDSERSTVHRGSLSILDEPKRVFACVGDGNAIDPCLEIDWLRANPQDRGDDTVVYSRRFVTLGWNEQSQELLVARDPLGMEPIYYAELSGGGIAVASRAVALLSLDGIRRDPDVLTCAEALLSLPRRPGATFLSNVKELPRASILRFDASGTRVRKYFQISPRAGVANCQDRQSEFLRGLTSSVSTSLRGASNPAVTLSGGIDSSSVFRLAHRIAGAKVMPITAVFPNDPGASESQFLNSALDGTGCEAVTLDPKHYYLPLCECIAAADDPQWVPLSSITLACARVCKQNEGDRMLTGQFGDFVGGSVTNPIMWLFGNREWTRGIRESMGIGGSAGRQIGRIVWQGLQAHSSMARHLAARKRLDHENALVWLRLISPSVRRQLDLDDRLRLNWAEDLDPRQSFVRRAERFYDWRTPRIYGSGWLAERLFGVTVDHPFVDVSLAQIAAGWTFDDCWAEGRPRALLRTSMRGIVPDDILGRRTKANFEAHHRHYFRWINSEIPSNETCWPIDELLGIDLAYGRGDETFQRSDAAYSLATLKVASRWLRTLLS